MKDPRMKNPNLAPYVSHGIELEPASGDEWAGDCPFCGKEEHLYVNEDRGVFACKVCGEKGNVVTFLEKLHALRLDDTTDSDLQAIAKDRGLPVKAFEGVAAFDRERKKWLLPARNAGGRVHDIRRWPCGPDKRVHTTAGCASQLIGANDAASAPGARIWVCEGDWDWIAWRWVIGELSMQKKEVAVGVPGADTFKDEWAKVFQGRDVVLCYDNDPAGAKGEARAEEKLRGVAKSIAKVSWPDGRPSGWDMRDQVTKRKDGVNAAASWQAISKLIEPVHSKSPVPVGEKPATLEQVVTALKEYAIVNEDMIAGLKVMLAVCCSNSMHSDPLWVYIVGAASHGKTLLAESLDASSDVIMRSCIKPQNLISGFQTGKADKEGDDPSLIAQLKNKTLIVKDWTELLALPESQRDETFSILRGAFDGSTERGYGNLVHRKYSEHRFSMIACVTHRIHAESQAHMGERFLKFQFKRQSEESQDAISLRAMGHVDDDVPRKKIKAVAASFLARKMDRPPDLPEPMKLKILALAKIIGLMRTNVERNWAGDSLYRPVPEAPTRLCKQLAKLGRCLAHVSGRDHVNADDFTILKRVAFDTAYGFHLDVVDAMMKAGGEATQSKIAEDADLPTTSIARKFEDLQMLKAVEKTSNTVASGKGRPSAVWRVAKHLKAAWKQALID